MFSSDDCIVNGICVPGTIVNVRVNDTEKYTFYVIKDDCQEFTLIMNKNLGSEVAWISNEDYGCEGTSCAKNNKGPITALEDLKDRTKNWINIESREYTYTDDGGQKRYKTITMNMRARMLRKAEAIELGCDLEDYRKCPSYLYVNLKYSGDPKQPETYLLSSAHVSDFMAWHIKHPQGGAGNCIAVYTNNYSGIRPVITLSK